MTRKKIKYKIPVGTLVELETGERLYVIEHTVDDGDGTPIYMLGVKNHHWSVEDGERGNDLSYVGFEREKLNIIKLP